MCGIRLVSCPLSDFDISGAEFSASPPTVSFRQWTLICLCISNGYIGALKSYTSLTGTSSHDGVRFIYFTACPYTGHVIKN